MSKQHYDLATYTVQMNVAYLVKRSHSLMYDIMEPVIEQRGFTFMQYVVLAALRLGSCIVDGEAIVGGPSVEAA